MTDVNCMTCLVNVAKGLEVLQGPGNIAIYDGLHHAVVWEMGPGRFANACLYELTNPYGRLLEWRYKGPTR